MHGTLPRAAGECGGANEPAGLGSSRIVARVLRQQMVTSPHIAGRIPGISRDERIEVITHLAFYAGWPTANTAVAIARRVFEEHGA